MLLSGAELITWLQTRQLSDRASLKTDQYLMNSSRRSFRNINVSTRVHNVTCEDRWIWHYTQPKECIFLIDLSIFQWIQARIKMDRPGIFLSCALLIWPCVLITTVSYQAAQAIRQQQWRNDERLRLAFYSELVLDRDKVSIVLKSNVIKKHPAAGTCDGS